MYGSLSFNILIDECSSWILTKISHLSSRPGEVGLLVTVNRIFSLHLLAFLKFLL